MRSTVSSGKKPKTVKESRFFQDFVKITGSLPGLIWMRPKLYYVGDKKKCRVKKGVLIAPNHSSFFDPVMVYCTFWWRRLNFLVTKDLYKNEFFSWMITTVGCIQVDKENFSIQSMHAVVDRLKAGKAVVIFPEGQVNFREQSKEYKSGAVLMAKLAGVPIQPVHIVPGRKWYQRRVALIGEPIDISNMCSRFPTVDELQKVSDYIRSQELALAEYYQTIQKERSKK